MKHVVVPVDLQEADIKPAPLFNRFRELSIRDAREFFGDPSVLAEVRCPACGAAEKHGVFEKHGFRYCQCESCHSVFVSPRPGSEVLADYYANSEAVEFRAEQVSQVAGEARRAKVLRAHALWLGRLFDEAASSTTRSYADVGTIYPRIFEEIRALELFDSYYCWHPLTGLEAACREVAEVVEQLPEGLGAVTAFEQLEHQFEPGELLRAIAGKLAPGGLLYLTTRTIDGFDLQTLWDKVPYIYVPEHLNLPSTRGLQQLVESSGFEILELSTPGQLDLQLIQAAANEDPSVELPRSLRVLLGERGVDAHIDFQAFLQKHRLSSHIQIVAVKR